MEFRKITRAEFAEFVNHSPYQNFFQTPEYASFCAQNGWRPLYFAVRNPYGKILAAALVVSKPTFLGRKCTYLVPGGPLVDFRNLELTQFCLRRLARYAFFNHGYILYFDPYYELIQRDHHGLPLDGGLNREKARKNLSLLGYRPSPRLILPQYLFARDLANFAPSQPKIAPDQNSNVSSSSNVVAPIALSPDAVPLAGGSYSAAALFSSLKPSVQNLLRSASAQNLRLRELTREELPSAADLFKNLPAAPKTLKSSKTSKSSKTPPEIRELQDPKNLPAFIEAFAPHDRLKILVAESPSASLATPTNPQNPPNPSSPTAPTDISPQIAPAPENSPGQTNSLSSTILAAALFVVTNREVTYLCSASQNPTTTSTRSSSNVSPVEYLLIWQMLKTTLETSQASDPSQPRPTRFNLYSLPDLPDSRPENNAVYNFKNSFGDQILELLGPYQIPVKPHLCRLRHLLKM